MSEHFGYLLDDDSNTFFQKVAEERAVSSMPKRKARTALRLEKTAAPEPVSSFEKIAASLDRNIELIKVAGPCGSGLEASARALSFIQRFDSDESITNEQYAGIFSKVAMEALDADIAQVRADFHLDSPEDDHEAIDIELGKFAFEIIGDLGDSIEKLAGSRAKFLNSLGKRLSGGLDDIAKGRGPSAVKAKTRGMTGRAVDKVRGATSAGVGRARNAWGHTKTMARNAPSNIAAAPSVLRGAAAGKWAKHLKRRQTRLSNKDAFLTRRRNAAEASHAKAKKSGDVQVMAQSKSVLDQSHRAHKKTQRKLTKTTASLGKTTGLKGTKGKKAARRSNSGSASKGKKGAAEAVEGTKENVEKAQKAAPAAAGKGGKANRPQGDEDLSPPGKNWGWKETAGSKASRAKATEGAAPKGTKTGTNEGKFVDPKKERVTVDKNGKWSFKNTETGEDLLGKRTATDRLNQSQAKTQGAAPRVDKKRTPAHQSPGRWAKQNKKAKKKDAAVRRGEADRAKKEYRAKDKRLDAIARGKAARAKRAPSAAMIAEKGKAGKGLWGKAYNEGWGALTDAEKTKLSIQGVGGVAAYKVLTD